MSQMRYTIVHDNGGVSFVDDEFMLPALVAACSTNPRTYENLLDAAHEFDRRPRDHVRHALAVFDEHNVPGSYEAIHRTLAELPETDVPPFRIVDERTRRASMQPVKAGLVVFNLKERRINAMRRCERPPTTSSGVLWKAGPMPGPSAFSSWARFFGAQSWGTGR